MNDLEFVFEEAPWEGFLEGKNPGETVSALQLLTLMEQEDADALEELLMQLDERELTLELSGLYFPAPSGKTQQRMQKEIAIVESGFSQINLRGNDPLRLYLEEIAQTPSWGDEAQLAAEAASGSDSAKQQLAALGLSRVAELSGAYVGKNVLLLDLLQEGSLGLWQAVSSYSGGEYAPYRDRWICNAMGRAVVLQAHSSGIAGKLREAMEDFTSVEEQLVSDLGRLPTLGEIAEKMHISEDNAQAIRKMIEDARQQNENNPKPQQPEAEEEEDQSADNTAYFQLRQRISELLSVLSEEDAKILTYRYGLEGSPLSPEETGRKLDMSAEKVAAREIAALAKLRTEQ